MAAKINKNKISKNTKWKPAVYQEIQDTTCASPFYSQEQLFAQNRAGPFSLLKSTLASPCHAKALLISVSTPQCHQKGKHPNNQSFEEQLKNKKLS